MSTMTPREIVRRTLDYDRPERVARTFPPASDLLGVTCTAKTHATAWAEVGGGRWERLDEWGNTWHRADPTSKGEVKKGVLDRLDDFDHYRFPDHSNPADYEVVKKARAENPDQWLMGLVPGFAFNISRKMRRLDHYLMDLVSEPEKVGRIHDAVDAMVSDMIRNYAAAGADSIFFLEDWGTQQNLMISPRLWRKEFFPRYQKLCGIARDCGIRVFMHSCGYNAAIVPGVMEAGVSLLQFDQPDLYGIDNLAAFQEVGKITFWCPVDIQRTLQTRDEKIIRAKADEMLDKLWRGRGGFIAGFYEDEPSIGLDSAVQAWASDEFLVRGKAEYFKS